MAGNLDAFNPTELLLVALALLHEKYGTVFNTVAPGTDLSGLLVRKKP